MNPANLTQLGALLGVIAALLIGIVLCEEEEDIQPQIVLLGPGNLTCHSCFRSEHESCVNFDTHLVPFKEQCTAAQQYCMVHMQKTDDNLVVFERGCTTDCTEGCNKVGSLFTIEHCYLCCDDNDCNYQDIPGAGKKSLHVVGILSMILPILLCLWLS